ncbi:MAG: VWA domain-containing protein [Oscillochloridaceae bacterium umkhey_bin13]
MSLILSLAPQPLRLAALHEPQLTYVLVTINADAGAGTAPVRWAVIADASRSMRIPIVSEDQFRELVRAGGAQEVLVDGMPVWQLTAPVPEVIKASAPSALDHTARALHSLIERLDRTDQLVLIACAEEALLLVAASGERRHELVAGIARLPSLRLGEQTNLAAGLELALTQLGRLPRAAGAVNRILLLTDGFTRDSEACLALARAASEQGISLSTLGLGGEFQDDLLTQLADLSGGRASYVRRAEQIPAAVAAELEAARGVSAQALSLSIRLTRGVTLRHATRLNPTLAPLSWEQQSEQILLRLGDLEQGNPISLLLELLAPALPPRPVAGGARMRLAQVQAQSGRAEARADLVATYEVGSVAPPAPILTAAARAATVRLQHRAAAAASRGNAPEAARLLRSAAARLRDLGETNLAAAALHEATNLERTGQDSGLGARDLTYATRRLGQL